MQVVSHIMSPVHSSNLSEGLHVCANFSRTVDIVAEQLNKSTPVNKLKQFLSALCHPLMPEKNFIRRSVYEHKLTTMEVILSLIPQYINYVSYDLLEEIKEAKAALNAYKRETRKYRLRKISQPTSDEDIDMFHGQKRLKVTVNVDEEKVTLDDVHEVNVV